MFNFQWKNHRDMISPTYMGTQNAKDLIEAKFKEAYTNQAMDEEYTIEAYYFKDQKYVNYSGLGNTRRKKMVMIVGNAHTNRGEEEPVYQGNTICGTQFMKSKRDFGEQEGVVVRYNDVDVAEIIYSKPGTGTNFYVLVLGDVYTLDSFYMARTFELITKEICKILVELGVEPKPFRELDDNARANFIDKISNIAQSLVKSKLDDDRNMLLSYERSIETAKQKIVDYVRKRDVLMRTMPSLEDMKNKATDKIKGDLEQIMGNKKVKNLSVEDEWLVVKTEPLTIYDNRDNPYYGGEFKIKINLQNSDVRFFNSEGRRGYWSDHDPHPHVSGNGGSACLGNVSSTIAELVSQVELYALVTVCISFLESANEDDPAGLNIRNWDGYVDGKIIPAEQYMHDTRLNDEPFEDEFRCDECGHIYHEDDGYIAWERIRIYGNSYSDLSYEGAEYRVCQDCLNEFEYNEEFDVYAEEIIDERIECADCGTLFSSDDMVLVYEAIEVNEDGDVEYKGYEEYVCDSCVEYNAEFCEEAGEWARTITRLGGDE